MNELPGDKVLLVIVGSLQTEDLLVDWLLGRDELSGFSSKPVSGYSREHAGLSIEEQVEGRRKQVMFQMHLEQVQARQLVEALKSDFSHAGLHYWLAPLLDAEHIE